MQLLLSTEISLIISNSLMQYFMLTNMYLMFAICVSKIIFPGF